MKNSFPFEVRKVKKYKKARYASESAHNLIGHAVWLNWCFAEKVVKGAVTLLLVAGVSLGSYSCDESSDDNSNLPECTEDEITCHDENQIRTCNAYFQQFNPPQNCYEYCMEKLGDDAYTTNGCNAEKTDNPCTCEYAIVDGDMEECTPSQIYCDGNDLVTCDEYMWDRLSCESACKSIGSNMVSRGCDKDIEFNPCLCEPATECSGDEYQCDGDWYIRTCNEATEVLNPRKDCNTYCIETEGEDYLSNSGCEPEQPDNPCNCHYGRTDGVAEDK